MADKSDRNSTPVEQPPMSNLVQSDGVQLDAEEVTIGGDVAGRDQIQSAGGHIIRAEAGATVIIEEHPLVQMPPPAPTVRPGLPRLPRPVVIALVGAVLLGLAGLWAASRWMNPPQDVPTVPEPPPALVTLAIPFTDCPTTLPEEVYQALTRFLATEAISATLQRGDTPAQVGISAQATPPATLILQGQCSGDQVTYHVEILIPPQEMAEPESVNLTWAQDSVEIPARILGGIVAYYAGDIEKAAAQLNATVPNWTQLPLSEQAGFQFVLGNAWLRHQEQPVDEAIRLYTEALTNSLETSNPASVWLANVHNNRGLALVANRLSRDAETEFDAALEAQPNNVWAMVNRSLAHAKRNQIEQALEDCSQAYKSSGQAALGEGCRAQVYYWQDPPSTPQVLLEAAQKAARANPPYVAAYYYAGVASCQLGDTEAARRWLEGFVKLSRHPILVPLARSGYLAPLQAGETCQP